MKSQIKILLSLVTLSCSLIGSDNNQLSYKGRINQLKNELDMYRTSWVKVVHVPNSDAQQLYLTVGKKEHLKKVREITNQYKGLFSLIDITLSLPQTEVTEKIKSFKLGTFKQNLKTYMKKCISKIKTHKSNKEIYAIVLSYDSDNNTMSLYWNNKSSFLQTLNQYTEKRASYKLEENKIRLKYNSGDFNYHAYKLDLDYSNVLDNTLHQHKLVFQKMYNIHNSDQIDRFFSTYHNLMIDSSTTVINELKDEFKTLNITDDCIIYLQLTDARPEEHFYTLQKTVKDETIKTIFKKQYIQFLD